MGEPVRTHQDLQYDADETAKGAISTAALAPGPKKNKPKKKTPGIIFKTRSLVGRNRSNKDRRAVACLVLLLQ
jgi:hypothetical protein